MNVLDGLAYCHLKKSIKKEIQCLRKNFLSPESTHNLFLSLPQNLKSHAYREKSRNIGALHNVSIARQQETNLFDLSILLIRVNNDKMFCLMSVHIYFIKKTKHGRNCVDTAMYLTVILARG